MNAALAQLKHRPQSGIGLFQNSIQVHAGLGRFRREGKGAEVGGQIQLGPFGLVIGDLELQMTPLVIEAEVIPRRSGLMPMVFHTQVMDVDRHFIVTED